jgi:copper oxidase (laccase) domain-containing protein
MMSSFPLIEVFPSLDSLPGLVHGFLLRSPEIDVDTDRETALARLAPYYEEQLALLGISPDHLATGEQIHGAVIQRVDGAGPSSGHFPGTDGLITGTAGQYIGVYVADCGAVFLADSVKRVCAAVAAMLEHYGSNPADLIVQVAPCIRPPAYEIDFAARIVADTIASGVPETNVIDCGTCTSRNLERYYSYRIEKGKTGRHIAVIGWSEKSNVHHSK